MRLAVVQVLTPLTNHVAAVAPAALIGIACGMLAIVFTVINLKVARLRIALLQARLHSLMPLFPAPLFPAPGCTCLACTSWSVLLARRT